jgi:hypothetical protein
MHSFCTACWYPLRPVFVLHADIPRAFHLTHCTMPKFSTPPPCTNTCVHYLQNCHVITYTHITHAPTNFLCALPILCTPRTPLLFFHVAPKFSAHTRTPTLSRTVSKFSLRASTPLFFRVMPNFYVSQYFYYTSHVFSAPTCAHSFLCASIPHEFRCKNWGFCLTFYPFLPYTLWNYEIYSISPR